MSSRHRHCQTSISVFVYGQTLQLARRRQFRCVQRRDSKLAEVGSGQREAVVDADKKEHRVIWCEVIELIKVSGSGG